MAEQSNVADDFVREGPKRRGKRVRAEGRIVRIDVKDRFGKPRWITADLVDHSSLGAGVTVSVPLIAGSVLSLRGRFGVGEPEVNQSVRVAWCMERPDGLFRAGLQFETGQQSDFQTFARKDDDELPDYYELLQLSPNADTETIHRVYRILAHRYHPDNTDTGNSADFVQITEAYQTISNPEKRAAYDVLHRSTRKRNWRIFDQSQAAGGIEAEQRKRNGILGLLYAKTVADPESASMTIHEFEDLLGCPREHLQAAIWYLKAKGHIQRSDSGRFTITISGFERAEEVPPPAPRPDSYLLEQPLAAG